MKVEAWDRCTDPVVMLESLRAPRWQRKLRLFACACCRHAWDLPTAYDQLVVGLVEQWGDGRLTLEEVRRRLDVQDPSFLKDAWDDTDQWYHLRRPLRRGRPEQLDEQELGYAEEERHWFPEILLLPDANRAARMTARGMQCSRERGGVRRAIQEPAEAVPAGRPGRVECRLG
jgi:hypothetical protein